MLQVLDLYVPSILQARLNSTVLSPKNSLDFGADDLWMICVSICIQANQDWIGINQILARLSYQTIPLYVPKYIMLPADTATSLQYAVLQKLKNIRISNDINAVLPGKINYYPRSIYYSLIQRSGNDLIKLFARDILNVIVADNAHGTDRYSIRLAQDEHQGRLIEPILRVLFDIINLSTLAYIEREIDPIHVIHQKNIQLAFEKLGGIYKKHEHSNKFGGLVAAASNTNLSLPLSTQEEDSANLSTINDHNTLITQGVKKSVLRNEGVQKALIGGAAIGLTYLLMNKAEGAHSDDEQDE
jgi:hypothetical protein